MTMRRDNGSGTNSNSWSRLLEQSRDTNEIHKLIFYVNVDSNSPW